MENKPKQIKSSHKCLFTSHSPVIMQNGMSVIIAVSRLPLTIDWQLIDSTYRQDTQRGLKVNQSEARIRDHSREAAGQVYNSKVTQYVYRPCTWRCMVRCAINVGFLHSFRLENRADILVISTLHLWCSSWIFQLKGMATWVVFVLTPVPKKQSLQELTAACWRTYLRRFQVLVYTAIRILDALKLLTGFTEMFTRCS